MLPLTSTKLSESRRSCIQTQGQTASPGLHDIVRETITSLGGLMLSHAPFLMNKKAHKFNKSDCSVAASNSLTLEWLDHHCHAICAIKKVLCDKNKGARDKLSLELGDQIITRSNGQTYFWCGQIITVLLFALWVCCVTNIREIDLVMCHNSIVWQTVQQVTNIGWCD